MIECVKRCGHSEVVARINSYTDVMERTDGRSKADTGRAGSGGRSYTCPKEDGTNERYSGARRTWPILRNAHDAATKATLSKHIPVRAVSSTRDAGCWTKERKANFDDDRAESSGTFAQILTLLSFARVR